MRSLSGGGYRHRGRRALAAGILGAALATSSVLVAAAAPARPASRAAARPSKTFVWAVAGSVTSLDSSNIQDIDNAAYDGARESSLLQYNLSNGCAVAPGAAQLVKSPLVKSWSQTDGGHDINFVLNRGVRSQDGNVLTSADVLWSFQRVQAVDPIGQFILYGLGGFDSKNLITVTGKYSFTLHVATPSVLSAQVLTLFWYEIYDAATVKAHAGPGDPWGKAWLTNNVADFGPWELSSFNPGVSATYVRNPYYRGPSGNIAKVVITSVADAASRTQLLQSGQADYVEDLNFDQLKTLSKTKGTTVLNCASPYRDFIGFNYNDKPFTNVNVRRAISLAINRAQIAKSVYRGFGVAASHGIDTAFNPTAGFKYQQYNVAEAKQLLAKAGYRHLTFSLLYSPGTPGDYVTALAIFLKSELAKAGITVNLSEVGQAATFSSDLKAGNFQAFIYSETPVFPDPGYSWLEENGCTSNQDFGHWCFKSIDSLAQKVEVASPTAKNRPSLENQLSAQIDSLEPLVYVADERGPQALRNCAAGIPIASTIRSPLLAQDNISC